jgi:4'-phosphopantetheinyl transferase
MEVVIERLRGSAVQAAALLSPDELARAARLRYTTHRDRFLLAHAFLRRCLALRLDVPPERVEFAFSPKGKPHVRGLWFSFSHSGDLAAVAVSAQQVVGIDIEQVRPIDVHTIAADHFTPAEAHALAASADPVAYFFRLWTRKEAVLKAYGLGIVDSLAEMPPAQVHDFVPAPGYVGAASTVSKEVPAGTSPGRR